MRFFLASLGMLFAAALLGYLVIRLRAAEWPPAGSSGLPAGLWLSTGLVLAASAAMLLAERAARRGRQRALGGWLACALLLTLGFLAAQVFNWMQVAAAAVFPQESLAAFGFYVLTFLHAVHVLAGLVPLLLVTLRARDGRYSAPGAEGLHLVGMYWHFLTVTWLAIFGVLNY
jgi:cytochrome c oxidase subunit 3